MPPLRLPEMDNMETNQTTIIDIQALADFKDLDFNNEEVNDKFLQILITNAKTYSRYTNTDMENYFSQFYCESQKIIHETLAEYLLDVLDLASNFTVNTKETLIYSNLLAYFYLLEATPEQIEAYDFSKLFCKASVKRKTVAQVNDTKIKSLVKEINSLKNITKYQTNLIVQILNENKSLKEDIKKVLVKLDSAPLSNKNLFNFGSTSTNTNNQPSVSYAEKLTINTNTPVSSSQGIKSTLANQNNNSNKSLRSALKPLGNRKNTHSQHKLKDFNSFEPNSQNRPIDLTNDNDGFTTVGNKKNNIKNRNQQNNNNSSNNINRNNNTYNCNNNINNKNNSNNNKK